MSSGDDKKDPKIQEKLMNDPAYLATIDPKYKELK